MERRAITIEGIVQGVGFRPFVHALATRLALRGFVCNRSGNVSIEVEGDPPSLDRFLDEIAIHPPPLAQIDQLSWERRPPRGETAFRIEISAETEDSLPPVFVGPDVATCDACLAELLDPADRRHRYPFLNCTHCGPRLTIIQGVPYDRERTTMACFPMCPECRREYDDPANRRFHAQPTACAACGPGLDLRDGQGKPIPGSDPLTVFAEAIKAGRIGALKGLGGFHLACDAGNEPAVAELRRRKHRDEKPFALMVRNIEDAEKLCLINVAERELLSAPRRPIVLLRKRPAIACPTAARAFAAKNEHVVAGSVSPGNPYLGVMLPYTPLHHLLLEAVGRALVMTSGNRSDEPIAHDNADALERLAGIADLFLLHNRPIHVRCDDSVTRVADGSELPLRRSRGYAPQPLTLPLACPAPILAVGGQLKGTFALGRGRHAFISHHLGDLDNYLAFRAFEQDIALYEQLFSLRPRVISHDLHPDYASARYALQRVQESHRDVSEAGTEVACLPVQHHHAHMASCMAEHGLDEPVIGVTFDGTGYGTDGAIWGGEFLMGDYRSFSRAAHLRYVGMPGGDQTIREPWRMAIAHLRAAGLEHTMFRERIEPAAERVIVQMLDRGLHSPPTSSMGRLFDAVAALAGVRDRVSFEGQAAMELEWLATETAADGSYPFEVVAGKEALEIDPRPLVRAVVEDVQRGSSSRTIARRFHSTVVEMVAQVCARIRAKFRLDRVVLSGGVFLNVLLTSEVCSRLSQDGFQVYRHRRVPPNDGGICLGQLAIAASRMACRGQRNASRPDPKER
jgi:hydrogenase maturation protein HypF